MSVRERVGLLTLFTRWNIKVTVYGGKGGVTNNIFIRWKIIPYTVTFIFHLVNSVSNPTLSLTDILLIVPSTLI
jgi:hypothetical protein